MADLLLHPSTADAKAVKQLADARGPGLNITIKRGVIDLSAPGTFNDFCVLRVKGLSDRLHIFLMGLKPVDESKVTGWPVTVSFALFAGMNCALDLRKPLSGPALDVATIASASDVRVGTVYHAANMLVQQWGLFVAIDPATNQAVSEWQATLVIEADRLGGGGKVEVYKGGIFLP